MDIILCTLEPPTKFSGEGALQDFSFYRRVGGLFEVGGCNFYIRNKLKSEIFNDKKKFINKNVCSVTTKNSNWEILTENLVTFKR